jgi:hypothetical protein
MSSENISSQAARIKRNVSFSAGLTHTRGLAQTHTTGENSLDFDAVLFVCVNRKKNFIAKFSLIQCTFRGFLPHNECKAVRVKALSGFGAFWCDRKHECARMGETKCHCEIFTFCVELRG